MKKSGLNTLSAIIRFVLNTPEVMVVRSPVIQSRLLWVYWTSLVVRQLEEEVL